MRGARSQRFSGPLPTGPSLAYIHPVGRYKESKDIFRLHLLFLKPKTIRKILENP